MTPRLLSSARGRHREVHRSGRAAWLRAATLGADDAIVSTASLMLGVAASAATTTATLVAGIAGLTAGALSMAAGEYVSVSSQRDAEHADLRRETQELRDDPRAELLELTAIYVRKGVPAELAKQVAEHLTREDALGAHLREELGIDPTALARPVQAALVSAASFATFGFVPIAALLCAPATFRMPIIAAASLCSLAGLGALGAALGGANRLRGAIRVVAGGGIAMGVTALIGSLLGRTLG